MVKKGTLFSTKCLTFQSMLVINISSDLMNERDYFTIRTASPQLPIQLRKEWKKSFRLNELINSLLSYGCIIIPLKDKWYYIYQPESRTYCPSPSLVSCLTSSEFFIHWGIKVLYEDFVFWPRQVTVRKKSFLKPLTISISIPSKMIETISTNITRTLVLMRIN